MNEPRPRWKIKFDSYAGVEWFSIRDRDQPEEPPVTMTVEEARQLRNRLNAELGEYVKRRLEKGKPSG
jgi:hypothetical protein